MKLNKQKVKSAFKKALVGVKTGYKETSKFVKTYGPPVHSGLSRMATDISQTFTAPRPRNTVNFRPRPLGRMRVRSRFDFDNLGMRF